MSFGIAAETTAGLVNITETGSVRLLGSTTITTKSGSQSAPSGSTQVFVEPRGSDLSISVELTNGNLVWSPSFTDPGTVDILVVFFGSNV